MRYPKHCTTKSSSILRSTRALAAELKARFQPQWSFHQKTWLVPALNPNFHYRSAKKFFQKKVKEEANTETPDDDEDEQQPATKRAPKRKAAEPKQAAKQPKKWNKHARHFDLLSGISRWQVQNLWFLDVAKSVSSPLIAFELFGIGNATKMGM